MLAFGLGLGPALVSAGPQKAAGTPISDPRRIIPDETADEAALRTLIAWNSMPTFGDGRYRQFDSHDRGTGQPVPIKLFAHGNRDMNNFICAGSGARAESSVFVPYTLDQARCPEAYVRGFVLARAEGSGRLARLWMAALSLRSGHPGPKVLRIYVDDGEKPFIQVPLAAVLRGRAGEILAPPFAAGIPGVFAWYYPVVFSTKLIVSIDGLGPFDLFYYQTAVVLDASPSRRTAAHSRLPARDEARAVLAASGDGPVRSTTTLVPATTFTLEPGVPVTVADLSGGATIESVRVRVASADVPALDDVRVSVEWDGGPPAIDHSLAMLLAAALDPPVTSSLALAGTVAGDDVILTLRLPMPFASRAVWSMTNQGAAPVALELAIGGEETLPPEPWGRLHTETHVTVGPTSAPYHPIASVSGRGRYLGTCLVLQGHQLPRGTFWADGLNFLEGAMRGWVDGEPAVPGTGTEAYLNSSFYFNGGEFGAPFTQAWGIGRDRPDRFGLQHGKVSACRWQVLGDAIDFQSSVEFLYEIGPGDPALLDRYRSIAFFYR